MMDRSTEPPAPDVAPTRTPPLSAAAFRRRFVDASAPCIVTGATEGWTAFGKWSFDWFRAHHGRAPIPICFNDGNPLMSTVGRYIELLLEHGEETGRRVGHAKNVLIPRYVPSIERDVPFPRYYPYESLTHKGLWLAHDGATSPVHCDFAHNMNAQIIGRKRFRLSRPDAIEPRHFHTRNHRTTLTTRDYDTDTPATATAPAMPRLRADYTFTLEPGEILFVPYGWWHKVTSIGPSISATCFFLTPALLASAACARLGMGDVTRRAVLALARPAEAHPR